MLLEIINQDMLRNFFIHNWCAIFYFNFKMLPFKQAIHLPFDFYGKVRFVNLCGSITLNPKKLKVGMIKIGAQGSDMFPKSETILNIKGDITIEDRLVLGMGSSLISLTGSTIRFGKNAIIGAKNLIYCEKSITFGDNFLTSWDCQIMDSDTHKVIDIETGDYNAVALNVVFGSNVWLGNGVIVNKGTNLPSNTIVASRSLCNKDYTCHGGNCVLAGSPAKVVSTNKRWEL